MGIMDKLSSSIDDVTLNSIFTRIATELREYENKFDDGDEEPQRVSRVPNIGREFNVLKPRDVNSTYYLLIIDPDYVEDYASSLIGKWKLDEKKVTTEMIQLIADVIGVQNIKIADYFGIVSYDKIVERMQHNILPVRYGYLLLADDNWAKSVILTITKFVKACVKVSERKGSLFNNIFCKVFDFLDDLCKSRMQPFMHTALFFAIIFCTEIGKIARSYKFVLAKFRTIVNDNDNYKTQIENIIERCETELHACLRYTDYLQSIILREGYQYTGMKKLYEFYVKNVPLLYISGDNDVQKLQFVSSIIFHLNNAMTDKLIPIAIDSLTIMLKDQRIIFNEISASKIISELHKLTLNNDLKVGVNAIRALCTATERYLKFFTEDLRREVFLFIYNKNSVLSKEAGRLFMHVQRQLNEDVKGILLDMANFRMSVPSCKKLPADFVVSVIDEAYELSNLGIIMEMLLDDKNLEFEQEVALLEIFTYVVIIKITGPSYDPEEVVEVVNKILPVLPKLFQTYSTEYLCLNNLLLIMKILPYKHVNLTQYQEKLCQIIKLYPKIFENTNDRCLLASISENLFQLSEFSPMQTLSLTRVKCITKKNLAVYKHLLTIPWSDDVQLHISDVLVKFTALRKFHPPIENEIFMPLRKLQQCNEEVLVHEFEYEANFLSQKFYKHAENNSEDDESLMSLLNMYNNFRDDLCESLGIFESLGSIAIALNTLVDMHVCLDATDHLPKNLFSENQIEIICLSIRRKLEYKDEDSVRLLKKFLYCLLAIKGPVSFYVLALFDKFYHLYGDIFESLVANAFEICYEKAGAMITSTLIREIICLQNKQVAVCENFTEIKQLSIRFITRTPKKSICTIANSWLEISSKCASHFLLMELVENLCTENFLTINDCKFLARKLQHLIYKIPSTQCRAKAKKLLEMLQNVYLPSINSFFTNDFLDQSFQ